MKENPLLALGSDDAVLEEIQRVTEIEKPVIRNLWITQHYHSLMGALAEVIGGNNSNWSTFATWASKTAGQSIRGEEMQRSRKWQKYDHARRQLFTSR